MMRSTEVCIITLIETDSYRILVVLVWKDRRVESKTTIFITMRYTSITTASNKQKFCSFKEKTSTDGKYKKVEFDRMQIQPLKSYARKKIHRYSPYVQQFMTVNVVKESTLDLIFQNQSFSQPLSVNGTMKWELLRICTFRNYPKSNGQSAIRLAAAGFFYNGKGDEVQCFSCKIKISGWFPQNVPMDRHRESSPSCHFVTIQNSGNVPISLSEQDSGYASPGVADGTHDTVDRAHYPDYVREGDRLQSFNRGWPDYVQQTPQMMSESGFFYAGYDDCVRCFQCGIGLRDWKPQDNINEEHAKWSPRCLFLLSAKGQDFINMVLMGEQSANIPPTSTQSTPCMTTLLQASQASQQRRSDTINTIQTSPRPNRVLAGQMSIRSVQTSATAADKESEIVELKYKNTILRERTICKMCVVEEVSVAFLPCGHLVVCKKCSSALDRCLVCREPIRSTIPTNLNG